MRLYSRPLSVEYHANLLSCSSLLSLVYIAACIILPYLVTYGLGGMWIREQPFRSQPRTIFRYEAVVEAYGVSSSTAITSWGWSTSSTLNDRLGTSLRPMLLSHWEEDDERDGKADRLQFVLRVPLDPDAGERLLSISVILGVKVAFEGEFDLLLDSALLLTASSALPGRVWNQTADLVLVSKDSQRSRALGRRSACPSPVEPLQEPVLPSGAPATPASILGAYAACNDTAVLVPQPALWTPGVSDSFEATLTVRIPPLLLSRRPGVAETLKLAFVQYVALFIPIAVLLTCLHGALFTTGVLAARVHHPIKQHRW